MQVIKTEFSGLLIIKPDVFKDGRGYFFEALHLEKFSEFGLNEKFVQDNISKSVKGTIRGLHYQTGKHAQGKLCQALTGKVLDISLDIRFGSPTFGKFFAYELSEDTHEQLWIPLGFAHGFSVLSEEAVFQYKCTAYYNKESERTILYNDPDLNIDWQVENEIVSEKDLSAKRFNTIEREFIFEK